MRHNPYTPTPRRLPAGLIAAAVLAVCLLLGGMLAWLAWQWHTFARSYPWLADTITISLWLGLAVFILWFLSLIGMGLHNRWAGRAAAASDKMIALKRAETQPAPNATSFSYHNAPQITSAPPLPAPEPVSAGLPAALDLSALNCNPTIDHILLGIDELGQITVSVPDLCHVALLGSTGGGKSNLLRLIMPQLQKIGASCILADPHYAPLDPENGDDWRPIADRLIHAPAVSADAIDQELSFMLDELQRRLERRRKNEPVGPPLFFAFDELPVICDLVKDATARLGKLLREGRKVQLLTIGASQSMLIKEIGGSSTLRDQYRTAFYVGGDRKSAAAMLDIPERAIDDGPLGKGVVLLRSKATAPARLVRVPLVSNASLYQLLNVASAPQIAPTEPLNIGSPVVPFGFQPAPKIAHSTPSGTQSEPSRNPAEPAPEAENLTPAETARILAFFGQGIDPPEIVRRVWPNLSKGRATQDKTKLVWAAIRAATKGTS